MSKRITRFEANQPDWQITIQYVGTPSFERVLRRPPAGGGCAARAGPSLAGPGRRAAARARRFNVASTEMAAAGAATRCRSGG